MPEIKLTTKQLAFCLEYVKDFNGTQAAIRAKYSTNTAAEQAYENLRKPHIKSKIDELLIEELNGLGTDTDGLITKLYQLASSNITDFISEEIINDEVYYTISYKHLKSLPKSITYAISEIQQTRDGVKIKLYSKLDALDKLARIAGMFKKDQELGMLDLNINIIEPPEPEE